MNILIIGKYPPIAGGVSAQTYWFAHELAARGHVVSVVTNGREVEPAFRIFMRPADWARCEAPSLSGDLRVYWSEPPDGGQWHIPAHNPSTTKLVSLGLEAARARGADVVFSFYLEPYGVAGHLLARELGVPHVVKTAGSDVGRLWQHPQLRPLYDRVFTHAAAVWTAPPVRTELAERCGVPAERLVGGGVGLIPAGLFEPAGAALDLDALIAEVRAEPGWGGAVSGVPRPDLAYVGIYGKVSEDKGIYDLLQALQRVRAAGAPAGLVVMGGGFDGRMRALRDQTRALGLADAVVRIPFLPHWRVPEFLRRCVAVCCLERQFSIELHRPMIARETMATGTCLIGSTEILRKMPRAERLASGYNCMAVADVTNHDALAAVLTAVVDGAAGARAVGARGRTYASGIAHGTDVDILEGVLERVRDARRIAPAVAAVPAAPRDRRPSAVRLLELVARRLAAHDAGDRGGDPPAPPPNDPDSVWAQGFADWLIDPARAGGAAAAADRDVAIACRMILDLPAPDARARADRFDASIARLSGVTGPLSDDELARRAFRPTPIDPTTRIARLAHDANQIMAAMHAGALPAAFDRRDSYLVVAADLEGRGPRIVVLDATAAAVLRAAGIEADEPPAAGPDDDRATAAATLTLFETGLIGLAAGAPS